MSRLSNRQLKEAVHPTNTGNGPYCLLTVGQDSTAVSTVRTTAMGGMVSAMTAVLCGTRRQPEDDDNHNTTKGPLTNDYRPTEYSNTNGNGSLASTPRTNLRNGYKHGRHQLNIPVNNFTELETESYESSYRTAEDSGNEFVDAVEFMTSPENPLTNHLDIPYADEDSDRSSLNTPRDERRSEEAPSNHNNTLSEVEHSTQDGAGEGEVIEVSEGEYSEDEEQEVESEPSEIDNMERLDSETEDNQIADGHDCDSDCEHSEEEIDDSSEACSDDEEEHACDSDCDHSEAESDVESEYEYESEEVVDSDDDDERVIELSDNEHSCDDDQQSESEEILVCGSDCESDCDGNHHECSSQCGCEQEDSDEENEDTKSTDNDNEEPQIEEVPQHDTTGYNHNYLPRQSNKSNTEQPVDIEISSKTNIHLTERNNNRLHRNHSQRIPTRSDGDVLGELKTAIDARVRRSLSCRETTSDYRKRYAHLRSSSDVADVSNDINNLELKDRELRRSDRRSRLRTLELKREQCLDEVRDGTEHNVTDRVYREAAKQEMMQRQLHHNL